MLNIKPILRFCDAELGSTELCRGRKKSLHKIIEKFLDYIEKEKIDLNEYTLVTGVGLMVPEFETFQEDLRKSLKEKGYHIETWETMQIGTTPFLELRSSIAVKAGKDFLNTWNCQTAGDIGIAEKCRKSVFFYLVLQDRYNFRNCAFSVNQIFLSIS